MDIVSVLENSGIFNGVSEETIASLAQKCEIRIYEDGDIIFREGDLEPRGLFILAGGEVILTTELVEKASETSSVEKKDFFLTSLRPCDTFGEISILDSGPRSATAKAHGLTTIVLVQEETLIETAKDDFQAGYLFTKNIARLVCTRLREADFAFKYKSLLG
jgi:CRP-like cAMP-binding protein